MTTRTVRGAVLATAILAALFAPSTAMSAPKLRLFETFSSKADPSAGAHVPQPHAPAPHLTPQSEPDTFRPQELPLSVPHALNRPANPAPPAQTSNLVVKLLDLPDTPEFQRSDGTYFDLGWRFSDRGSGEWVGYVGSPSDYMSISPQDLASIMRRANISVLPEPPRRLRPRENRPSKPQPGIDPSPFFGMLMSLILLTLGVRYVRQKVILAKQAAQAIFDGLKEPARRILEGQAPSPAVPGRSRPSHNSGIDAPMPTAGVLRAARTAPTAPTRRPTVVRRAPSLFSRLT